MSSLMWPKLDSVCNSQPVAYRRNPEAFMTEQVQLRSLLKSFLIWAARNSSGKTDGTGGETWGQLGESHIGSSHTFQNKSTDQT